MPISLTKRHTVYDVMDAKGIFAQNPANQGSMDPVTGMGIYKKQKFPKMFYHPEGKRTKPAPGTGATEIITALANNEEEEAKLRKDGWHDHPADAMAAAGEDAPAKSSQQQIDSLEDEVARLKKQLEEAKADKAKADAKGDGTVKPNSGPVAGNSLNLSK